MKHPGHPPTTPQVQPCALAMLPALSLFAVLLGGCGPGTGGEIVLPTLGASSPYVAVGTGISMSGSESNESAMSNEEADAGNSVAESSGEASTSPDGGAEDPEGTGDGDTELNPESNPGSDPDAGEQPDTGPGSTTAEPVACNASDESLQARFLERVNAARAQARSCGSTAFDAAPPVFWNDRLANAATTHSTDMVRHNFFGHTGSDGSSVATRVDAADYPWRTVGENIAAGQDSVSEAVDGWIASPGHCRNLMNPAFVDIALACVSDSNSDYRVYWTNVLAAPR